MSIPNPETWVDFVNWNNPGGALSLYFKLREALSIPSWKTLHTPSDSEKVNLVKMASTMDDIRELFDKPIVVHCWIRPKKLNNPESVYHGKDYNDFVGGAKRSAHISGLAVDFHVKGLDCDTVRGILYPRLGEFGIRMEDLPGSGWVHVDMREPGPSGRFFKVR